jgi:shikimate kinase
VVDPAPPVAAPERVVLVGFMGAGKSTIGPLLAGRLGWNFLDLDTRIEEATGRRIAELFRDEGEAAFRARERRAAEEAMRQARLVLAAGGGAFAQPGTREVLGKGSVTVWLRCDLPTILARVPADGSRPLATNRAIMQALLAEREPSYQLSDVVVDTSEGTPEGVVRQVLDKLRARGIRETAR